MKWIAFSVMLGLFAPASISAVGSTQQANVSAPSYRDWWKSIDANNISMFVTNFGVLAFDALTMSAGLEYPRGSGKHCVYAAGPWIGAQVNGETRVTVGAYSQEYGPGPINPGENPPWADPTLAEHRVYKIVAGDTTSPDYLEWPADHGAPVNAGGKPLLRGSQTLWCVYNDADPALHSALEGSTPPLGVEIQQTAFAYDWRVAFGNVVFMEFRLINKLAQTLENTYFGIWCDPDVGWPMNDYVGCDSVLDLGFAYNADNLDPVYGRRPPCIGIDMVRTPVDDSGTPLGMTSFSRIINALDPISSWESYNCLRGLGSEGNPVINPTTGDTTTYAVSGDPVAGTGWCDDNPNDVRFMICSGPFTMAPGDTQDIAIAVIAATGRDRIVSVHLMKEYDEAAQLAFDQDFVGQYLPRDAVPLEEGSTARRYPTIPIETGQEGAATWGNPDGLSWSAYPNPAVGSVRIRFNAEASHSARLVVFDTAGRVVRTLIPEDRSGAANEMIWDGRDEGGKPVPPGVYFIGLNCGGRTETGKIILVR